MRIRTVARRMATAWVPAVAVCCNLCSICGRRNGHMLEIAAELRIIIRARTSIAFIATHLACAISTNHSLAGDRSATVPGAAAERSTSEEWHAYSADLALIPLIRTLFSVIGVFISVISVPFCLFSVL